MPLAGIALDLGRSPEIDAVAATCCAASKYEARSLNIIDDRLVGRLGSSCCASHFDYAGLTHRGALRPSVERRPVRWSRRNRIKLNPEE